jgi:hypothetical protein
MSEERAQEISISLGLTGKGALSGLSAQLSQKSSTKVSFVAEKEVSRSIRLANDSNKLYRRFALWKEVHRLSVVLKLDQPATLADVREFTPRRITCSVSEFALSHVTSVTSIDIARP